MVVFADGSCKAQLSPPDMRYAFQYALAGPRRGPSAKLDADWSPTDFGQLGFAPLRADDYPCFRLAMRFLVRGGTWAAAFVGADAAAVELFLAGTIKFNQIADALGGAMERHRPEDAPAPERLAAVAAATADAVRGEWTV